MGAGPHSCWLGNYERGKPRQFVNLIVPGFCVFDIGANTGYYTLLASRFVGPTGTVFAFEPLPRNIQLLKAHIALNGLENVTVIPKAASNGDGFASFSAGNSPLMGKLSAGGEFEVETVTIDRMIEQNLAPLPQVIKIDVEGAECDVILGGEATIKKHRPAILLAGHSTAVQRRCEAMLESLGYRVDVDPCSGADGQYESLALPR